MMPSLYAIFANKEVRDYVFKAVLESVKNDDEET